MDSASSRILVVDDDPGMRTLLEAYLGDSGFAVETAVDGAAMWQALALGMPDAIVLDLMLPGEDGLSLARRLRSVSLSADAPGIRSPSASATTVCTQPSVSASNVSSRSSAAVCSGVAFGSKMP